MTLVHSITLRRGKGDSPPPVKMGQEKDGRQRLHMNFMSPGLLSESVTVASLFGTTAHEMSSKLEIFNIRYELQAIYCTSPILSSCA